jgi:hypothetical protein
MQLYALIIGLFIITNTMAPFATYRQLLIFGKEQHGALVQKQLQLLNTFSGDVKERDLKVRVVEKNNPLYRQYKVDSDQFTVILVGKDETEKHRVNRVLEIGELFAIIDAMPMRKAEMGKKN